MNKEDEVKFLKIQTCVLKVNIHCDGCKQKVKKLLQKVEGVFETAIDSEQGRVTVSGNVDPATLIKKLHKAGKHAELLHPKGVNITQLQKPNHKAQPNKDNGKPAKPGATAGGGGKDHTGQGAPMPQMKGLKDMKIPQLKDLKFPFQKDPKSVKFALPPEVGEDCSDYDDYDDDDDDDYDDEDIDEFDGFDADFDDDFRNIKLKPGSAQPNADNGVMMLPDKKNGKKGGVEIPVQVKGMNGNNDAKNGKKGGAIQNQGVGGAKNVGKVAVGGGGGAQDSKNTGNNGNYKPNPNSGKKGAAAGGGGAGAGGGAPGARGEPMRPPAGFPGGGNRAFPGGMNPGQMGLIPPMGHGVGAAQGLPQGMAPPGYFPAGGMPAMNPEMMAAAGAGAGNPYQQQYMAAMLQAQQQQRMMMNGQDRGYPPMWGNRFEEGKGSGRLNRHSQFQDLLRILREGF
ncbi:LOW QUALITY PROTEIN: heavy metal-associated isoprenylated plant protein 32-like [Phalaenopsis equestris]|uniref:LOW QUALITY PROTEIN: heavy metal-associated isoprenylated plant protein 32-like n=1 Tax=Phalaenopsis equestris TaxID=78828 RepID=UPI0009E37558|nr:LOW QUALITY PROTEIN: heavy metal-associated isoprenylated plant protein 32-like [Phalaenopsis equestris]